MKAGPAATDLVLLRKRTIWTLFTGAGLGSIPYFATTTVSPIAIHHMTGSETLAGLSLAAVSVGTGVGAIGVSRVMARGGRRLGLISGYGVAVAGSALGAFSLITGGAWLLVLAMGVIGAGNSANQLARFAAAEVAPAERRASAVSLVVWAGTIGAVIGPNVPAPFGTLAARWNFDPLAASYLAGLTFFAAAGLFYLVRLRPEPSTLTVEDVPAIAESTGPKTSKALTGPTARMAVVVLSLSQFVMVLIMTITPVHISTSGHDLTAVGVVLSAHYVGMFALSPLAGWFADRFGKTRAIWSGFALLVLSALAVAADPSEGGFILAGPLFLVGLGWCFAFVSGSALLTQGLPYEERARLQGWADTAVWTCSALSSIASGVLLSQFSYPIVSLAGGALALGAVVLLPGWRRAIPAGGG